MKGSEKDGNVRHLRKMKALTMKIETVTLINRYTESDILCIKYMTLIVKYFFLA